MNGARVDVAVFTNFTRDHLDYHGTMDAYAAAKARLFRWPGLRTAVINLDDPLGERLGPGNRGCPVSWATPSATTTATVWASSGPRPSSKPPPGSPSPWSAPMAGPR